MQIRTKRIGVPIEELMRWRRGKISVGERTFEGYRKVILGVAFYQIKVNDRWTAIDPSSVTGFCRMEYICQPSQPYDPQTV
jgi:hypothetical protein